MQLVARSAPAVDGAGDQEDVSLYLGVWLEVAGDAISAMRIQVSRVPA